MKPLHLKPWKIYLVILASLISLGAGTFSPLFTWTNPRQVLGFMGSAPKVDLYTRMVSDPGGRLHLFWVEQFEGQPSEMYYSVKDGDWSTPVNIFIGETLIYFDVLVTSDWRIHLAWADSGIHYTSALATEAGRISSWTKPVLVDERNSIFVNLAAGENGELFIVYPLTVEPISGQMVYSLDGGVSWSFPVQVAEPAAGKIFTRSATTIGEGNRVHAVFSSASLPNGYPPEEIWYVHSTSDFSGWTTPVRLAEGALSDPAMIRYNQKGILLTLSGTADIRGFFSMVTRDNGESWSELSENFAPGTAGLSELMGLVLDSGGDVHAVIDSDSPEAIYYLTWRSNIGWSSLVNISQTNFAELTTQVNNPLITLTLGNQLTVLYTQGNEGFFEVNNEIQTASQPPAPSPTGMGVSTETAQEGEPEQAVGTSLPTSPPTFGESGDTRLGTGGEPVLISALAVAALLFLIVVFNVRRRN